MFEIYTDGSCDPNPGVGSYGYVVLKNEIYLREFIRRESDLTTNNRMELKAIIEALRFLQWDDKAIIYSDSLLSVRTYNDWMSKWFKNEKRLAKKKNLDLVRELFELKKVRPYVIINWVKGHSDNYWNNYVDELVNNESKNKLHSMY